MCDYCSKKRPKNLDKKQEFVNNSISSEVDARIKGDKLILDYDAYSCDSSFYEEIKIKFCPMCGRSLNVG